MSDIVRFDHYDAGDPFTIEDVAVIPEVGGGGIKVFLPHQCDDWNIVEYAPTPAAAAEVLRDFISLAQETLTTLEAMT